MKLGDICTREVILADRAATLQQAARLMREHHVGMLLVTEAGGEGLQIAGVVTDRDVVVEAVAQGLDVARTEVGRLATRERLAALPAEADLGEAIAAMNERGVRRLLVSGEGGKLHGVVTLDDVLGALGHEMAALAAALRKNIEREAAERPPLALAPAPARTLHIPAYAYV
ncbi:MAG TPA: CBS domain-containing protein [Burkholderiales bacterium]|nr:CBS domain-containing protein [Burkholderiales bacterium]